MAIQPIGIAVVVAPAGKGMAVTEKPNSAPVIVATNGIGLPVNYVASGGVPVTTVA